MKKSQLILLLVGMGVSQANAEKIASTTPDDTAELPATEVEAFTSEVKTKQTELLKNDKEWLTSIETPIQKKYEEIQFRKAKQVFGLTHEEVKDLDYEATLKLGREKVSKTNNTTLDELQNKNVELENKLKDLNEVVIPKIKGEVDETKNSIEMESLLLKNLTPKDKKLRVAVDAALPALKAHLQAQGLKLVKDDKGELSVVVAATNLKPQSEDKTKILTFADIRDSKFNEWDFIEKSGGGQGKGAGLDGKVVTNVKTEGGDDVVISPHIAKAQEHLAGLKDTMAKKPD